jgi:hypothetical protein
MTGVDDLHHPTWTNEDIATAERLAVDWLAASERAFGSAFLDPAAYERTALLVGALLRRLREEGPGPAVLVAAWGRRTALVDELLASDPRLGPARAGHELAAGAAFALRYREVVDQISAAQRLHRLTGSVAQDGWVVLEESGSSDGDPFLPYRRVEAEPATGRALLVTTRPDDTFTGCVHEVVSGHIDGVSGALSWDDDGSGGGSCADTASREALASALKHSSTD